MAENCTHNCSECGEECSDRNTIQKEKLNALSNVKKVIGIVSGKGGVGKSLITSLLTVAANRQGKRTCVLDADITGPSIGKIFGIKEKALGNETGLLPITSPRGVDLMSVNFLLDSDTTPVIWRGAMIGNMVRQFWTDVIWDREDIMFIDMPPGTGDVPLTVFQSIPIDGIIVATSPQQLVTMIVEKAVNMANMMKIPIVGIVENMSYFSCPDCGKKVDIFGESQIEKIAERLNLDTVCRLPINPALAALCDSGEIESVSDEMIEPLLPLLKKIL